MTDQTVNLNAAECLRDINHLGYTTVHNVCTRADSVVPWGGVDWLGFFAVAGLFGGLLLILLTFSFVSARDMIRGY